MRLRKATCLSKKSSHWGVDKQPPMWYYNYRKEKVISMKEKLIEQLDRKLEQVRKAMNTWADSADMAIAFYNQAIGAVEFAGWLVYQDNPELEKEIIKMWNDEYRVKFEEIIWG